MKSFNYPEGFKELSNTQVAVSMNPEIQDVDSKTLLSRQNRASKPEASDTKDKK